jgi:threonine aldolase
MDRPVDLRSDTVTRPTPEMRRAMADAEVGDDVYGEDPTVNALQDAFAERVGKDTALFVPSGTMGNQLALRLLARPATTVVAGAQQHVVVYENGAAAVNAPVQFHTVDDGDGTITVDDVRFAVDAARHHWPSPSVVCVEDTHMPSGGRVWPIDRLRSVASVARDAGLALHLDGARLFHAEVASGVTVAERAASADTVMCCLSKGLCAPIGSLLAGPADVMAEARAARQRLGGGMRQAGVVAAAGLVALRSMVSRLADDHERARRLAAAVVDRWPDTTADVSAVETNIVVFRHDDPAALLAHLADEGVLAGTIAPGIVRFVTHHDVDAGDVDRVVKALATAP